MAYLQSNGSDRHSQALPGSSRPLTVRYKSPKVWRVGQPRYCYPEALIHRHHTGAHQRVYTLAAFPGRLNDGSRMSCEVHVRLCEGLGVKLPWSTHPHIPTRQGWLYLAIVLDPYSRQIVGWAMSDSNNRQLVCDALTMAIVYRHSPNQAYCIIRIVALPTPVRNIVS